jgi:antitoxin component YwqK of YwqJK toxin-antitoxin module
MKWILGVALLGMTGWALTRAAHSAPQDAGDPSAPGVVTTYFPSGQLKSAIAFEDGKKQGLCRLYFADGSLEAEGSYANGRMSGAWSFHKADGTLDENRSGTYQDGQRIE